MRAREFIAGLAGAAAAWPFVARAQQPAHAGDRVFIHSGTRRCLGPLCVHFARAKRNGLPKAEMCTVEYHWVEGKYDRLRRCSPIWFVAGSP